MLFIVTQKYETLKINLTKDMETENHKTSLKLNEP